LGQIDLEVGLIHRDGGSRFLLRKQSSGEPPLREGCFSRGGKALSTSSNPRRCFSKNLVTFINLFLIFVNCMLVLRGYPVVVCTYSTWDDKAWMNIKQNI
jgi:hypothetical protein